MAGSFKSLSTATRSTKKDRTDAYERDIMKKTEQLSSTAGEAFGPAFIGGCGLIFLAIVWGLWGLFVWQTGQMVRLAISLPVGGGLAWLLWRPIVTWNRAIRACEDHAAALNAKPKS